jgi:ATP adenylyltransferase
LCEAGRDESGDRERLVLERTSHHVVLLNRYPYTNGHLMVAPLEHQEDPGSCSLEAQRELWPLLLRCREALAAVYSPDGFNLGANLGSAAGAGVPGHFHVHLLPRWDGDTNFMSTVGGTRLVPEALDESWARLRSRFRDIPAGGE